MKRHILNIWSSKCFENLFKTINSSTHARPPPPEDMPHKLHIDALPDFSEMDASPEAFCSFSCHDDAFTAPPLEFAVATGSLGYAHRRAHQFRCKASSAPFQPSSSDVLAVPDSAPGCYLKRFTRDGRFIIAFGGDSRLLLYRVIYPGAGSILNRANLTSISSTTRWEDFVEAGAPIEIDVGRFEGQAATLLCRDFCLQVDNDLLIVAGSIPALLGSSTYPQTVVIHGTESISCIETVDCALVLPSLDHVTFYLVSIKSMRVLDRVSIKYDLVYLSHHLGVGFAGNSFSVLLLKAQSLLILSIEAPASGQPRFNPTFASHFNSPSPLNIVPPCPSLAVINAEPSGSDAPFLAQNLLRPHPLHEQLLAYCQSLSAAEIQSLCIWRHQLLSPRHALLRLASAATILATTPRHQSAVHATDPSPPPTTASFIALYDLQENAFVTVHNSADERLTDWLTRHWDWLFEGSKGEASALAYWDSLERSMRTVSASASSKSGPIPLSVNQLRRRFTNVLPVAPQSFHLAHSPWLDCSVTGASRFDDRIGWILGRVAPVPVALVSGESVRVFGSFSDSRLATRLASSDPVSDANNPERHAPGPSASGRRGYFTIDFPDDASSPANAIDRHRWVNILPHPHLPLILVYQFGLFRAHSLTIIHRS